MEHKYYVERFTQTPRDDETIEEFVNRFLKEGVPNDFWDLHDGWTDAKVKMLWTHNIVLALANRMNIDPFQLPTDED
jgi:hypothetical protein